MSKPRATIWADSEGFICCRTYGYVEEYPIEIKQNIKGKLKSWNMRNDRIWRFDPSVYDIASFITEKYYDVTYVKDESPSTSVDTYTGDPYSEFLRCLPDMLLKKVYRLIVSDLHPDKGGSSEEMAKINSLWQVIKKDRNIK